MAPPLGSLPTVPAGNALRSAAQLFLALVSLVVAMGSALFKFSVAVGTEGHPHCPGEVLVAGRTGNGQLGVGQAHTIGEVPNLSSDGSRTATTTVVVLQFAQSPAVAGRADMADGLDGHVERPRHGVRPPVPLVRRQG